MAQSFTKDPQAVLDYQINWADWLSGGDTISASTWAVSPTGTLTIASETETTTTTKVWLSGGTVGRNYRVTNHITTVGARQDDRTLIITVTEK